MRNAQYWLVTAVVFTLLLTGCAAKPAISADDPITGTWSGDYGPDAERRDPVKLELTLKDGKLDGTIHAGPRSLPIRTASFVLDTGAITMEFDAQGNNGQTVHYRAEGKVEGKQMSGSWTHDAQRGDFKVTRQ
jgi:hypothetical protein